MGRTDGLDDLDQLTHGELQSILAYSAEAVKALVHHCDILDNPDVYRLLDFMHYGRTEDGEEVLPFPRQPLKTSKGAYVDPERVAESK